MAARIRVTALLVILVLFSFTHAAVPAPQTKPLLAIAGGRLIDGYGGRPLENAVILVEGNRVKEVGQAGSLAIPAGAKIIDAEGMTVMPGIADMHVHLMLVGHGDYDHWFRAYPPQWRDIVMPIAAKELLMAGVTMARDLGARLEDIIPVRDRINRGEIPGPRMFVSGPFLQKTAPPLEAEFRWAVSGAEDARAKTQKVIDAGVDVVKVIDQDQMSFEELKTIVDTAHAAGRTVAAHAHREDEIRMAIRAGVDCLEHTGLATEPGYPEDILAMVAKRNATLYWCPTLEGLFLYQYTENFPERLDNRRLKHDLPPEMYKDVRESLRHIDQLSYFSLTKRRLPTLETKFNQMRRAGVTIITGTDSGIPMNFHYESTWQEMAWMARFGMPPMEAIRAATYWPAQLLKKGNDLGTIAPGKLADIIVVDGDPLQDMTAMRNVVHVVKDGVQYK